MNLILPDNPTKESVFQAVGDYLASLSLQIEDIDTTKPWGGAYYIAKDSTDDFIKIFFPEISLQDLYRYGEKLRPKILIVGPGEILSWQYHNRRAEIWKSLLPVGIMRSDNDDQPTTHNVLNIGQIAKQDNQTRHRIIGLEHWGVLAEIWQHTDPDNLSTEEDVVRLEDSYGRK